MKFLYNIGIICYGVAIRLASLFNPKAQLWVVGRKNQFARMRAALAGNEAPVAWFHAASLGEFEQGRPVIEEFRRRAPHYKILVTFFSPSGYEIRKDYKGADWIFYLPLDTPRAARRFMKIVRPEIGVFIKYEFWINHLQAAARGGVRLFVISALFQPRQIFFRPWGGLFRRMLGWFEHIFVQNESARELLRGIGIESVSVAGDTRYDRVWHIAQNAPQLPEIEKFAAGAQVFVAGSTWPHDEELLLQLIRSHRDTKFILAPHEIHPDRIEKFRAECGGNSLRYTQLDSQSDLAAAEVLFIDTIGILSKVYRYGAYAYIGGGFGAGIHNTLEGAAFGLPMAFGPRYERFAEAVELIGRGGACSINDYEELCVWFESLRNDPVKYRAAAQGCIDTVATGVGATDLIMNRLIRE